MFFDNIERSFPAPCQDAKKNLQLMAIILMMWAVMS
jgi:hypothetical protein